MPPPLALFLLIAQGAEARQGWAIPMATDAAFALGIATLFASRVPLGLRAMLLTFVIVNDIGTVFAIAGPFGVAAFSLLPRIPRRHRPLMIER